MSEADPKSAAGSASGADLARAALAAARRRAREVEDGRAAQRRDRKGGSARRSGARPDDRDPQLLEATLARLLAEVGWETPAAVGSVIHGWADIVGARIAAHCVPLSYDDGVLTVQTDSSAWATELRNLSSTLLTRLNASVPRRRGPSGATEPAITRLSVLGPNVPDWRKGRLSAGGRGPRDTYG